MNTENERNSVFEIERLLAMYMIVFEHALFSMSLNTDKIFSPVDSISWFIEAFTVCAVNLFFLLTGFFSKEKNVNIKKTISLWGKTVFYSVTIYLIIVIATDLNLSIGGFFKYLFPTLFKQYWFMQVYLLLIILSPFYLRMLSTMKKREFSFFLAVLLFFFCIHQTFIPVEYTLDQTQGYGIIWALVMFAVGKYIALYGNDFIEKRNQWFFLIGYMLIGIMMYISNYLIVSLNIAQGVQSRANFYDYNSITVFFESVFLFCFFVKKSKSEIHSSFINNIAKSAIAVYLISSHPLLLMSTWTQIFELNYEDGLIKFFVLIAILSLFIVFICIFIDKIVNIIFRRIKISSKIIT